MRISEVGCERCDDLLSGRGPHRYYSCLSGLDSDPQIDTTAPQPNVVDEQLTL
jgi:hypothetical protein